MMTAKKTSRELVRDIMTAGATTVDLNTSIETVAETMKDIVVGAVPVCDDGKLVGMITDRDITMRVIAAKRTPDDTMVQDVMSGEPVFCFDDQDVEEANRLMQEKKIRRLPVLNHQQQVVGIVSLGDLAVRGHSRNTAKTLRAVSEPL